MTRQMPIRNCKIPAINEGKKQRKMKFAVPMSYSVLQESKLQISFRAAIFPYLWQEFYSFEPVFDKS